MNASGEAICKNCSSQDFKTFNVEMSFHFPWREGLDQPNVYALQEVTVCLICGFAEFLVSETELRALAKAA